MGILALHSAGVQRNATTGSESVRAKLGDAEGESREGARVTGAETGEPSEVADRGRELHGAPRGGASERPGRRGEEMRVSEEAIGEARCPS